jgi:hypothetical protein
MPVMQAKDGAQLQALEDVLSLDRETTAEG